MDANSAKERRVNLLIVGAALFVVVVGALLFVSWLRDAASGYEPDCDSYSFDRSEWRYEQNRGIDDDSREHQAEALAECGALEGKTHAEVAELLGDGDREPRRTWRYHAGWVNDGIGPGDGQTLYVRFGSDGRVERATLAYPQ